MKIENRWRAIVNRQSSIVSYVIALTLFLCTLAVYVRTAAPSVMAGDSAEFQMAAVLLGVPHPTTYPLYIMLGKLATLLIPFYDLARRVTLVSSVAAALTVALMFLLARRVTGGTLAALVAALALAVTPGLWNAATMAEVYALLALLLVALGYFLIADCRLVLSAAEGSQIADWQNQEPRTKNREPRTEKKSQGDTSSAVPQFHSSFSSRSLAHSLTRSPARPLILAAFIAGLGFSHHGLFVFTGMPLFVGYVAWRLFGRTSWSRRPSGSSLRGQSYDALAHPLTRSSAHLLTVASAFILGLTPWLYTLAQYARYGPFNGEDYGLPRQYFWGAPASWPEAANLLLGGPIRQGAFRVPTVAHIGATVQFVGERLWFEFGPLGVALGALGCAVLLLRQRDVWIGTTAVFAGTLLYLLLLGPAVQDAPVFTLPMLLPWALWVGVGVQAIYDLRFTIYDLQARSDERRTTNDERRRPSGRLTRSPAHLLITSLLLLATLAWGYTRVPYANKRHQWLFRKWGQATLQQLPPRAVVIAHWEQGMLLQYLVLAEQQRPDVWVDVVEPGDVPWGARATRYPDRPVFFAGAVADVAGLPVEQVGAAEYAGTFKLIK